MECNCLLAQSHFKTMITFENNFFSREALSTGFSQVLESTGIWKVLESPGILNLYKKSWKCPGILHNICLVNFLFQVVHNEFLPSCYVRYCTSFFFFVYLFLELKYNKYVGIYFHNYFLFTFDRKCLKIIAFSKQDGLKMNGSSIGLGKK